jgi:hypothetical protein
MVLKKNLKQADKKGCKGEDRWIGPYRVEKVTPKGLYILSRNGRKLKTAPNPSHVKPYKEPKH